MQQGISETKELIKAVMDLAIASLEEFSDGIQLRDAWAIVTKLQGSVKFREAVERAYKDASKIPDEISDLNADEIIELVMTMLPYIPKIVKAAKHHRQ